MSGRDLAASKLRVEIEILKTNVRAKGVFSVNLPGDTSVIRVDIFELGGRGV